MEVFKNLETLDQGPLPLSLDFVAFLEAIDTFPEDMPFPPVVVKTLETLRSTERIREERVDQEKRGDRPRSRSYALSYSDSVKSDDSNEDRKPRAATDTTPPGEIIIHQINPEEFLTDFSQLFDTVESSILAGGLVIIAKTTQASLAYAENVYNSPRSEKELVLWTDASWDMKHPELLACSAVTFKQAPYENMWCDKITAMRGSRNAPFELFGIYQAIQVALRRCAQTSGQEVVKVFTDCQPAMSMILTPEKYYDADVQDLLGAISHLAKELVKRGCQLELHWVKAHDGVSGNVRVDTLASLTRRVLRKHKFRWIADYLQFDELPLDGIIQKEEPVDYRLSQSALARYILSYKFVGQRLR